MFICEKHNSCCNHKYWDRTEDIEQEAKECGHLIEVEPVRHRRWIHNRDTGEVRCPDCNALWGIGTRYDEVVGDGRYCFYCGAKMDLEE